MKAYQAENGLVVFTELKRDLAKQNYKTIELPCGQCVGCRLERSRQWAIRCTHEAQLHQNNTYVTLTYDDDNIPEHGSLKYRDFQLFMKRTRKARTGELVRFYMCGEYGEKKQRPHYHACIFNFAPSDGKPWKKNATGHTLYTSKELTQLWGLGHASYGAVTFESAAYVARYIMKKITGDQAAQHYGVIDPETGEIHQRQPEFAHMSLKPGIGAGWLQKYKSDVYPNGICIINGQKVKPPKYYEKKYKKEMPDQYEELQWTREKEINKTDNTRQRLRIKEIVTTAKIKQLKRTI